MGTIGVWPSRSDVVTIARHFNAGLVVKSTQVPEGRPSLPDEMEGHGGNIVPSIQPSLRDLWPCASTPALKRRAIVGLSLPGRRRAVARRTMLGDDGNQMPQIYRLTGRAKCFSRVNSHSAIRIPHLNDSFPEFRRGILKFGVPALAGPGRLKAGLPNKWRC